MTSRHPTFRDAELDAQLDELGYVVIDLLAPGDVEELTRLVDLLLVDDRAGFHASNLSGAHAYRAAVDRDVRPIIAAAADAAGVFDDHESFTASLLVKWPDEGSAFHTHQDWTMVDEDRFRTVNAWCPLVDASEENGSLAVLPGSHRHLRAIRCSPMPPSDFTSPGWQVSYEDMISIPVRAGQAIVFDHALLHSSGPNRSGTWRPAAAAAFKPRSADLYHWYLPDPSGRELEVLSVDPAFFTSIDIGDRPAYPTVRTDRFEAEPMSTRELLLRCGVEVGPEPVDAVDAAPPYGAALVPPAAPVAPPEPEAAPEPAAYADGVGQRPRPPLPQRLGRYARRWAGELRSR